MAPMCRAARRLNLFFYQGCQISAQIGSNLFLNGAILPFSVYFDLTSVRFVPFVGKLAHIGPKLDTPLLHAGYYTFM